ncbi:hypothetical protein AXG93_2655s1000 [Marchantia polymorpha subsp. ruderalis]|uniref:Uncharacterized protein n=1 Tax=Marchantia polymorpha subsp. ruderalis TaxID=1480154 RepID=A0A176VYT5_MARPO|nr:hypothetical protein AXG93_2655s1000 [Marchantia polymorpha subsp. ruderalis]
MFSLASIAYWDVQSLPLLLATLLVSAIMFTLGFVALYSELMGRASLDQAGVDFTLFQSADAIISLIGWQLAAVAGEALGYAFCFASASVFGLITLKLLPRIRQIAFAYARDDRDAQYYAIGYKDTGRTGAVGMPALTRAHKHGFSRMIP